jgi:hypothetical protein
LEGCELLAIGQRLPAGWASKRLSSHRVAGKSSGFHGTVGGAGGLSVGVNGHRESSTSSARERLRAVQDRQVRTLAGFVALEAKSARMRAALGVLEGEQRAALGELADVAGVELAAQLTGVATAKVREALIESQRVGGVHLAPEVGS